MGVQLSNRWSKIFRSFRISERIVNIGSELRITDRKQNSFLNHNHLLRAATTNPMQNLNSTQNFGSSTFTSAYVDGPKYA